jgi:DNA-binding NarL/FixJ family response regulator
MSKIIINIIDDHEFLLAGLVTLLKPHTQIEVSRTFMQVAEMMDHLSTQLPDVLLMDLLMPEKSGKELVPELLQLYPELKILVLTSIDTPAMMSTMMRKGCRGYALKDAKPAALAKAIETVHNNEEYIEPSIQRQLLQNSIKYKSNLRQNPDIHPLLSKREKEILKLIAEEYTTKEISEQLFINFKTAESHRYNLMQKLNVKNTVGLIKAAIQLGYL